MYLKIHKTKEGRIVAACDRELLGKILDDGKICIDLKAYRSFYEGELVSGAEVESALQDFSSANLIGEKAVSAALSSGLARQSDVIYINKTPHIQLYSL